MDLNTLGELGELKDRLNLSGMGRPAFVGIVAVLLVAAVLAGWRLTGTAVANEFEVSKASSQAESSSSVTGESEPKSIFVHVAGSVANPGMYELAEGSRVADAVKAAGSFADGAATDSINLARTLVDGEQVIVPAEDEEAQSAPQDAGPSGSARAAAGSSGLVNINTASAVELVTLPGIGEATAAKIVADRQANGPYKTIEDLKRVSGIGDRRLEALSTLICI